MNNKCSSFLNYKFKIQMKILNIYFRIVWIDLTKYFGF